MVSMQFVAYTDNLLSCEGRTFTSQSQPNKAKKRNVTTTHFQIKVRYCIGNQRTVHHAQQRKEVCIVVVRYTSLIPLSMQYRRRVVVFRGWIFWSWNVRLGYMRTVLGIGKPAALCPLVKIQECDELFRCPCYCQRSHLIATIVHPCPLCIAVPSLTIVNQFWTLERLRCRFPGTPMWWMA